MWLSSQVTKADHKPFDWWPKNGTFLPSPKQARKLTCAVLLHIRGNLEDHLQKD